jgi:signal transduction histidine kinase
LIPSDQRQFGGTGLGLNISREIIEALGGVIDYESTLGEGTTFYIELPTIPEADAKGQAAKMGQSQDATALKNATI